MSLLRNLNYAEQAVKYVEQHLRGKASNKPEDIVHTLQQNLRGQGYDHGRILDTLNAPAEAGERMDAILQTRRAAINDARTDRRWADTRLSHSAIITDGIGNCFEHSVLACHYLNTKHIASYIAETDDDTNHVFVVIGAADDLDEETIIVQPAVTPGPPSATATTVVCDPWYHEWFGIQQHWTLKMRRILMTTNRRAAGLRANVPLTFTASNHVT